VSNLSEYCGSRGKMAYVSPLGSLAIGRVLDLKSLNRRTRAFTGWAILFLMVFVVHIWAYFYQKQYTREETSAKDYVKMDFKDHGYAGRVVLYIFCVSLDAS